MGLIIKWPQVFKQKYTGGYLLFRGGINLLYNKNLRTMSHVENNSIFDNAQCLLQAHDSLNVVDIVRHQI
jgi:hypothetical protein